ncbi:Sister chromatid cohesion protein PDS5 [Senna tora]|uniref:Sister chromatid cohesion protein PDS5 n=1 Tax=Senna tora TaxID=362788 RepID=A0A834WCV5_9FABA|nr:Sister chromatid cohesion protein PDS5 [Senna tora]
MPLDLRSFRVGRRRKDSHAAAQEGERQPVTMTAIFRGKEDGDDDARYPKCLSFSSYLNSKNDFFYGAEYHGCSKCPHRMPRYLNFWAFNYSSTTTQPILEALTSLKDALVSRNFYKNEDENVKIATISCIIEITRITSPNPPYSDEQMKTVSPPWALGEKVIRNCAIQLKPYLMQAVQSSGRDLNDYAQRVTSICQDESNKMVYIYIAILFLYVL